MGKLELGSLAPIFVRRNSFEVSSSEVDAFPGARRHCRFSASGLLHAFKADETLTCYLVHVNSSVHHERLQSRATWVQATLRRLGPSPHLLVIGMRPHDFEHLDKEAVIARPFGRTPQVTPFSNTKTAVAAPAATPVATPSVNAGTVAARAIAEGGVLQAGIDAVKGDLT